MRTQYPLVVVAFVCDGKKLCVSFDMTKFSLVTTFSLIAKWLVLTNKPLKLGYIG